MVTFSLTTLLDQWNLILAWFIQYKKEYYKRYRQAARKIYEEWVCCYLEQISQYRTTIFLTLQLLEQITCSLCAVHSAIILTTDVSKHHQRPTLIVELQECAYSLTQGCIKIIHETNCYVHAIWRDFLQLRQDQFWPITHPFVGVSLYFRGQSTVSKRPKSSSVNIVSRC